MKTEVQSAVGFVKTLLKGKTEKVEKFCESFENVLCSHYEDHWFPEKPFKGSAYRCMRIVNRKMDPLILEAGRNVGYSELELLNLLPAEFTLWVDPNEVSYRIGEEGSIGVLMATETDNSQTSDSDSDTSDSSGSLSSSPAPLAQDYSSYTRYHNDQYYSQQQYYSYSHVQEPMHPVTNWTDYMSTFVAS